MHLQRLKGSWLKPGAGTGTPVDVEVFGFAQASNADGQIRPVAIIQEPQENCLRYVELKFVTIFEGQVDAEAR